MLCNDMMQEVMLVCLLAQTSPLASPSSTVLTLLSSIRVYPSIYSSNPNVIYTSILSPNLPSIHHSLAQTL